MGGLFCREGRRGHRPGLAVPGLVCVCDRQVECEKLREGAGREGLLTASSAGAGLLCVCQTRGNPVPCRLSPQVLCP